MSTGAAKSAGHVGILRLIKLMPTCFRNFSIDGRKPEIRIKFVRKIKRFDFLLSLKYILIFIRINFLSGFL
jgi:intein-encoded DNA endonuclease-like protein